MKYVLAIVAAIVAPLGAQAITIDVVPIGNPNNAGEIQPALLTPGSIIIGKVVASYQIGKTEVTNAQYVAFLNAKAVTDTFALYSAAMGSSFTDGGILRTGASGSFAYAVKPTAIGAGPGGNDYTYGDKPVADVSWFDAIRFANWMHNGQGSGSTETGAYTLLGGTPTPTSPDSIVRNSGAKWFLPTENEWYKAAYYHAAGSPSYYDYPTSTDSAPDNQLPSSDMGNSANYYLANVTTGDPSYPMTPAGAYTLSDSPYGTFDQGGNVREWNETAITIGSTVKRGRRGGSWNLDENPAAPGATPLSSAYRDAASAGVELNTVGFRLATVAAVPGDYNANGVVDAADYVVWRAHSGMTYQLQNEVMGTSPGMVTTADYDAWRERFSNISGAAAGNALEFAAVPEPGSCILTLVAMAIFGASRRRERLTS